MLTGVYADAAELCRASRAWLKSRAPWEMGQAARTTAEVLSPYIARADLGPDDLPRVFRLPGRAPRGARPSYGGERWAQIAQRLRDLRAAIDGGDAVRADQICDSVAMLWHNSARLVPIGEAEQRQWRANAWLREKCRSSATSRKRWPCGRPDDRLAPVPREGLR